MKPKLTPLHTLPSDALHLMLSHLSMHDVLNVSAAFPDLSSSLAAHLSHATLSPPLSCLRSSFPAMLPHLTRVAIHQVPPHPAVLASAASLRHLTVSLPHRLSEQQLTQLLRYVPNLSALTVQSTALPTRFFSLLAAYAHSLVALRLSFVSSLSFADQYVTPLWHAAHRTLRSVRLHACDRVDDQFVARMARHCVALQSLCISAARNVSDHALQSVCQSPLARRLRRLHIGDCAISDNCLFAVATSCTALSELSLWCCNGVSTWGIRAVAEGLGAFLQRLSIAHCVHVGEEAFESIADNCDSLSYLRVACLPQFTDDAMMALFDTARLGRMQLRTLHVVDCPCISEVAIAAAAGVLDADNHDEWRVARVARMAHGECEAYARSDQACGSGNSVCMCARCDERCCDHDGHYEEREEEDEGSTCSGASCSDSECERSLQQARQYDEAAEHDKQAAKKSHGGSSGGEGGGEAVSEGCAERRCWRWHCADGNGGQEGRYYESSVSELYAPDVMVSARAQQRLREGRRGVRLQLDGVVIGSVAQRRHGCCDQEGWAM